PEGEGLPPHHGRHAPQARRVIEKIQGPDLVLRSPSTPVAHTCGDLGESGGNGHARTLVPLARISGLVILFNGSPPRLSGGGDRTILTVRRRLTHRVGGVGNEYTCGGLFGIERALEDRGGRHRP